MRERLEIGRRLKKLRKKKNFSQRFVAENLYISQAAYSLIENSQNGIIAEHIIKLSNLYEVTTDFILKGDKLLVKTTPENGFVPFIKANAHAGFIDKSKNGYIADDYDWYRIPGFKPHRDQKLFEVEGESMVPTILPGDVLICQTETRLDNLLDGTVVIVITTKEVWVKRLRLDKNPDVFLLENDNPKEPGKERIRKSDIKQVLVVRGKISSVLVPHHELAAKGKIIAMEESIDFLKKELYNINKTLGSLANKWGLR